MARFPALIEQYQDRYPKVKLELHEYPSKEIQQKISEGRLDAGFVENVTSSADLEVREIDSETLGVLLPKKHPLANRKEIHFHDLENETIILHHRREAEQFYDRISHLVRGMKKRPKIYIKNENETCPILVATGRGISLTIAGSKNFAPNQTHFVPIKDMYIPVSVLWRKDNNDPSLKTFVSFALEKKALLPQTEECLILES